VSNYKSNHKKKFLAQKGQVAVIIALLIVCLIGMAALVIDLGSLYQKRASFQTVADSAALAGAQELPENKDDLDGAIRVAINYAKIYYNVDITSYDVEISTTYAADDTITVTPSDSVPVYFAGVLGINTVDVGASAKAMVGEPKQVYYLVPWAAIVPVGTTNWWNVLVPGTDKYITTYKGTGSTSNFCAWNEASSLPPDWSTIYKNRIINGCSFPLSIGNTIYVREIKMTPSSEIVDPTNTRVTQGGGVWDTFGSLVTIEGGLIKLAKSSDTQLVIVPVIEGPKALGAQATILAFAPFILEGIRGAGSGTQIYGRFIDQALIVYDGEVKGVVLKGLRVIRLIR
jgi:hypothetical protein